MPILKSSGNNFCLVNEFELFGDNEVATTKAFAFLLANSKQFLGLFLKYIDLNVRADSALYRSVEVSIEKKRDEGRTDVEIVSQKEFHVIVEAKIKTNKLSSQRKQYLKAFLEVPNKHYCFITSERISFNSMHNDIKNSYITWRQILSVAENALKNATNEKEKALLNKFIRFYERRISMREQREILIQDLSMKSEIELFGSHNIYRRDKTYGTPLYFAPHFTQKANQSKGVGISYLSRVLGVLTVAPSDILEFKEDLHAFTKESENGKELLVKWLSGVKIMKAQRKVQTIYFLDDPVEISPALQKDGGNKKGRGKDWIAAMITKNRCVSFLKFTQKIMEAKNIANK